MLVTQLCPTLQPHELQPARLPCPWNFPGKNAGVGCHSLLQGIFPTQGPPHCRQILYHVSHQGICLGYIQILCQFYMKDLNISEVY